MKLVHRLPSIGKTGNTQFLNACTRLHGHSNLPLPMADAYKKSLSLKKFDSPLAASLKASTIAVLKWTLASFNITASKKRGERGNAFKVILGQLGHLQSRLVDPLWHIFLILLYFSDATFIFFSCCCIITFFLLFIVYRFCILVNRTHNSVERLRCVF